MSLIDYSGNEGNAYHISHHGEFLGHQRLLEAWGHYAQWTYFPFLHEGQSVLEIGAGVGANLVFVKNIAKVCAVEPGTLAQEHCASLGIPVFSSLDELPDHSKFDAILLRHVLEHVPDPRTLLVKLLNFLVAKGRLIIVLPVESPFGPIRADDPDHHLYNWNRQTIANLLEHASYRVISSRIHWFNGKNLFLPIYQWFGIRAYARAIRLLGCLRRHSEIIMEAGSHS